MSVYEQADELARRLKKQVIDREITLDEATDELFSFFVNNGIDRTRVAAELAVDPKPHGSM